MTAVLPLIPAAPSQTAAANPGVPSHRAWLARAGAALARMLGGLRGRAGSANEPRLSAELRRDLALPPERHIEAPIWGPAGGVWRPVWGPAGIVWRP